MTFWYRKLSNRKDLRAMSILMLLALSFGLVETARVNAQRPIGGTLTGEQAGDITHLVQPVSSGGSWWTDFSLFDRLVDVDADTAEIIPGLAKSWEVSADGLTYTFRLYNNVKWHDGTKFTSADVKYTYDYIINNKMPGRAYLVPTTKIETPDDYTVKMILSEPNSAFLSYLGTWTMNLCILPKHIYDVGIPWEKNPNIYKPIGTGPFKFQELKSGQYAKLVRYDDYHKGRPYLDSVVWRIVPDVSVAMQMLKSAELTILGCGNAIPFSELGVLSKTSGIAVRGAPLGGEDIFALEINVGDPKSPFYDVRVRRALSMAINRQELEDRVCFGYTKAGKSIFTEDIAWCFNPNAKYPDYNPQEAEKLLDEAGLRRGPDGIRFRTSIIYGTYFGNVNQGLAEVISTQLAKVGIECKHSLLEWVTWFDKTRTKHEFDLSIFLHYAGPDPDMVRARIYTNDRHNAMQYSNKRVDELFDLGRKTAGQKDRAKYYFEIQEILAQELPVIGLIDQDWWFATRSDYHDFWFDKGVEATRMNPWRTWWEGGKVEEKTVTRITTALTTSASMAETLFPVVAIVAVVAIAALIAMLLRRPKQKS
jgi:peptide/nickel transport system substrate-binding protein